MEKQTTSVYFKSIRSTKGTKSIKGQKEMSVFQKVHEAVRKIPKGKVSTYGEIARLVGSRDVRKVGWALHANPDSSKTPCHRVVNKEGGLARGYAFGGAGEQKKKLEAEGVSFKDADHVDLQQVLWKPGLG